MSPPRAWAAVRSNRPPKRRRTPSVYEAADRSFGVRLFRVALMYMSLESDQHHHQYAPVLVGRTANLMPRHSRALGSSCQYLDGNSRAQTCLANRAARVRIGLLRPRLPDRMASRVPPDLRRIHRRIGGGAGDLHRRPGRRRRAAGIACGSPPASDPAVRATRSHRRAVGGRQPAAALPGPDAVHRRRRDATPGPGRRHCRPARVERAGAGGAHPGDGRNAAGRRSAA